MTEDVGPRPKTAYHHGDLRTALLAAAEQELIEKGIEGFTLRGVAKRAGVSHAAPAHHFRDTGDLLTALAVVAAQRFYATMKAKQERSAQDPRSQFIASGQGYIEFALANPALFELMFGSRRADFSCEDFSKPSLASFMVLVKDVADLRGDNALDHVEGRADILTAWSLVHGLANLLIAGRLRFLEGDLEADRDGTILRALERVVPGSAKV
jgi:AcrR family transcriptional regulator